MAVYKIPVFVLNQRSPTILIFGAVVDSVNIVYPIIGAPPPGILTSTFLPFLVTVTPDPVKSMSLTDLKRYLPSSSL